MILAMWIAVRMTFIALETNPAEGAERMARLSRPPRLAMRAPGPQQSIPLKRHNAGQHNSIWDKAGFASSGEPHVPRRSAHAAGRRPLAPAMVAAGPTADDFVAVSERLPEERERFAGPLMPYFAPQAAQAGAGADPERGVPGKRVRPRVPRWSADGWLLLRSGDQAPALAANAAAYGASQAGAVLRYGFAPANRLRPQAYLRISGALGAGVRQNEAALGLMIRPVRRLPLAVLGEWRLQDQSGLTRARPVVMAVTEIPPLRLPLGIEAEAYAQGGWAGGRDPTPFYDLATTFQRRVVSPLPGAQVSAGGGVWSGGQRGAARLDVGPRIELRGMLGPPSRRIGVRVGLDWRFRVAGSARPGSGPALTVAAGF